MAETFSAISDAVAAMLRLRGVAETQGHPGWTLLRRGQSAYLDDGWVCASAADWDAPVRDNPACSQWKPGTPVRVLDWVHRPLMPNVRPEPKVTFVRVRDGSGRIGVVSNRRLLPVVPSGTAIQIPHRDEGEGWLEPATVLEQPASLGRVSIRIRTASGEERVIRLRDVLDLRGNEINALRDLEVEPYR